MVDDMVQGGGPVDNTPSEGDLLTRKFQELRGLFSEYHGNVDRNRQFYNMQFAGEVLPNDSSNLWAYVPPTARRAVDEPADHILIMPKVSIPVRPSVAENTFHEEAAAAKRRFTNAWWQNVTNMYNPLGDGKKILLNEGRLCVKKTLRWELIPDMPIRQPGESIASFNKRRKKFKTLMGKLGHFEFLWDVAILDNKTVFEDPTNHRDPAYVFVEYEILREQAARMFPHVKNLWRAGRDYEPVLYREYWERPKFHFDGTWDPGRFVQWVDDKVVHSGENPYPYIPIAIDDSGYGVVHRSSKPHEKYVGIAQFVWDTFIAQARQYTSWQAVTEIAAGAPLMARNWDPSKRIHLGPREVILLDGDKDAPGAESVEYLPHPGLPLEVIQLAQQTENIVDSAVKMNVLSGQPLRGVETATEADQQIRNASSKLSGPVAALDRMATKLTSWVLMDVDIVIESRITLFGSGKGTAENAEITIGPKEIEGFYKASVELTTTDEEAVALNKARFWMDAYNGNPFMSAVTAMVKGGMTDEPLREMVQRAAEDVFLGQNYRAIRELTASQSMGEVIQMLQQMTTAAQGGTEGELAPPPTVPNALTNGGTEQTRENEIFANATRNRSTNQGASAELRAGVPY